MKTSITLINPPYPVGSHQHPAFVPLGLGYLAAVLEKHGYTVNVIDCQAHKITLEQLRGELAKKQADLVGVTCTTLTYKSALRVAKVAKEVYPNCLVAIGGPH